MAPRIELTSDHLVILPRAAGWVDSPPGSIPAVLEGANSASLGGTNVLPLPFLLRLAKDPPVFVR
jgi:hypothetical protein